MTPQMIALRFSLLANERRALKPDDVNHIAALIDTLPVADVADTPCWVCSPRRRFHVFLDATPQGQVVVGDGVVIRTVRTAVDRFDNQTRLDPEGKLLNLLNAKVADHTPDDGLPPATPERCDEIPSPIVAPCVCGGPADFNQWASAVTLLNNSCFNFALRDVWCDGGPGFVKGAPTNGAVVDWTIALERAGLIRVQDWHEVPKGSRKDEGWHVALAIAPSGDGHFLRLDDDGRWCQKMATLRPQACDAAGCTIRTNRILDADLCDYRVRGFFWARCGIKVHTTDATKD